MRNRLAETTRKEPPGRQSAVGPLQSSLGNSLRVKSKIGSAAKSGNRLDASMKSRSSARGSPRGSASPRSPRSPRSKAAPKQQSPRRDEPMHADEGPSREDLGDVFRGAAAANNEDVPMNSEEPHEDDAAQVISKTRDKSPAQPQSNPSAGKDLEPEDVPMVDIPDDRDLDAVLNDAELKTLSPEKRRAMEYISTRIN